MKPQQRHYFRVKKKETSELQQTVSTPITTK